MPRGGPCPRRSTFDLRSTIALRRSKVEGRTSASSNVGGSLLPDEPFLHRHREELQSGRDTIFLVQPVEAGFHRRLSQTEALADLLVRQPFVEKGQDAALLVRFQRLCGGGRSRRARGHLL